MNRKAVRAITPMKIITLRIFKPALEVINFLIEINALFVAIDPPSASYMHSADMITQGPMASNHAGYSEKIWKSNLARLHLFL